jgi:prefoldin subunit 1
MQMKMQTSSRQLAALRAQVQGKERERRIGELACKDLDAFSESTVAYKAVGKM